MADVSVRRRFGLLLFACLALGMLAGAFALADARPSARINRPRVARAAPVVGLTRAYALVVPSCGGCDTKKLGSSPVVRNQSMNVVVEPARVGAPEGTKCFALAGGLREADATVVVTAVNTGGPYRQHFVIEDARWVFGAPDCIRDANVIEIQTSGLMVEGAKLISVPDNEVAFAFSVESR